MRKIKKTFKVWISYFLLYFVCAATVSSFVYFIYWALGCIATIALFDVMFILVGGGTWVTINITDYEKERGWL
jgi:type III secretory pathway component EscU